ncbi:transcriptional regulator [Gallibacterium genomosp. 2]|uniref:GntR family transcriptional regulator n=4 Tax=Gallibacterium TaxID=155493 RepID=U1I8C9_9PAST|nr:MULTISPECIES: transcriptional regulator ExuR [Gallibacterium]ERF78524.1 GntR family transcriptional regulator [Gallibacterium anatis 12656/12]KGQ25313.1 transcriptional regulator [Gallibacterium anatis CCM5995]KGQ33840.1 transcriptional regulator [Gallibacterium genomosp. 2]KGQ45001.1 transcriptional regulator [Gallibacterium anatis]KGQ60541.1 transcriptional regulator [Gallibacterium anatis]
MKLNDNQRLYQQLAQDLKNRIISGIYKVGEKLPAERFIAEEMDVSRTVVREAIIMLEVEGFVEVKKGSGIHVISTSPKKSSQLNEFKGLEFSKCGPFELLQARQLIESIIAEFAATQVTKEDIIDLMEIQKNALQEDRFRDSEWDLKFHTKIAQITRNSALVTIVQEMWQQRILNPYWRKLHDHIDSRSIDSWCKEHDDILHALMKKDPEAAKIAMWRHLEHTKQMLFNGANDDFEISIDKYMFSDNPVIHLSDSIFSSSDNLNNKKDI